MAVDQNMIELVVFAGAAVGIAGRTILPYFKARTENDGGLKFEAKYVFAAAYSAILSIAGGIFLFPQIIPTVNPTATMFSIFVLSFTTGWTSNDIANFIQSSLRPAEATAKLQSKVATETKEDPTPAA